MWTWEGGGYPMKPLQPNVHADGTPWHSSPTQTLPQVYVQNASLEMSWTSNVEIHGTISGRKVIPFLTEGWEGFNIDYPEDWEAAERHAREISSVAGI
jgi:N-acylneuraminate cytidylyltransferase